MDRPGRQHYCPFTRVVRTRRECETNPLKCEFFCEKMVSLLLGNICDAICCFRLRAKLAKLCRLFERQVTLWGQKYCKEINFSRCKALPRRINDRTLKTLLRQCGQGIDRLVMHGCSRPSDKSLAAIVRFCPSLRHVDIGRHGSRCDDACPKCTTGSESAVTDAGVLLLAKGCTRMTSLDASQCAQLTDAAVVSIGSHCGHRLHRLNVGAINSPLTDTALLALATHCSDLQWLDIYGVRYINDESIGAIARGCRNLRSLNIGMCHNLTNTSLEYLAGCMSLLRLETNGCNFDDTGVVEFARRSLLAHDNAFTQWSLSANDTAGSSLAPPPVPVPTTAVRSPRFEPSLSWMTPPPSLSLGRPLCRLERLDVSECTYLSDAAITTVANTFAEKLKGLNISYCHLLTDSSLSALAVHCTNLEVFTALECNNFTDSALSLLIERCSASLRCLRLGSELMSDVIVQFIAVRCPDIEVIDIAGNNRLSDFSVECVARRCRKLLKLHLPSWRRLTDKALHAVTSGCKSLTSLDVSGCHQITYRALEQAATNLRNLRCILCRYCPQVNGKFSFCRACNSCHSFRENKKAASRV